MFTKNLFKLSLTLVVLLMTVAAMTLAQTTFYVNNQTGLDGYNGLSATVGSTGVGPKLTISNAIAAAVDGDIISIAYTGVDYGAMATSGKKLTFTSIGGTPAASSMTIDAATSFSGPVALGGSGTLTLTAAVTNANNITINSGGTISRGASGTLDVAPAFAGTAKLYYTGSSVTIGPEMPTAASVLSDLTVNGAITITVSKALTMSGTLTVNNAGGKLDLGGNLLTITTTTTSLSHSIVGVVAATAGGGISATATTATVTFGGAGGNLPSLTTNVSSSGSVVVSGPTTITGSVTDAAGALTLTTPTHITVDLVNNGSGTVTVTPAITIDGNLANTSTGVVTFANVNVTVKGNATNSGAQTNSTTTQISGKGNITFGDGVIEVDGNVTNSATFAGTSGDVTLGGFANCGKIIFLSTTNTVLIKGLLTNQSQSTFTTTAAVTAATLFSDCGRVTFATTSGNVTITGGITNATTGFGDLGTTPIAASPENGSVVFTARTSATITTGTGGNVTNNSTCVSTIAGYAVGKIDFAAAATGAETIGGGVSLDNSGGTSGIIFGTGASSITGTVSNARTNANAAINFNQTATSVSVGGLSQTGKGSIIFASIGGNISVNTGGAVTVSLGEIKLAAMTTGAITVNGNFTMTGGKFTASALSTGGVNVTGNFSLSSGTCDISATGASNVAITGDFSFTGGTLNLGAGTRNFAVTGANITIASGTAYGSGAATTLVLNRGTSAQTLTSGVGVKWPGNLNINNTFPAAPTFNLVGGNLIVTGTAIFSAGGATDGVNLNNYTLFVKGTTSPSFTNNSGYTGGANGFVSLAGGGAQVVNGSAKFFNIECDNAAGVTFGTGAALTYTITGTFNLTNGVVSTGAGDAIELKNATTPPTIVRNNGQFAGTPTMSSNINVVYIGASKTMTNEIPVGGSNKLVNLTIATTGTATITVAAAFEFSGTLTINSGQKLDLVTFTVTCNGASIVSNGTWAATTGKLVLNKAAGTTITATAALPQIDVAAASLGNTISGSSGITVGTTPSLSLVGGTGSVTVSFTGNGPHIGANLVTASGSTDAVTLGSNVIVGGVLTHLGGSISLGTNNLTVKGAGSSMDGNAAITGTGNLIFNVTGNSNFSIVTTAATIAANVTLNLDLLASKLTLDQANALTISGTLTLTKGTFDLTPGALTLTGNALGLTANSATSGTGVLQFKPASGALTVTLAGATTFNNLTIDGDVTLAGTSGALTISTTLTHKSGLLTIADRDIITGTFTRTGGTYSATTGNLEVGTALTQGTGFSIPNLRINGTFTVASTQAFTVSGTLHLLSGTLTHTIGSTSYLNMPVGATVQVTGGALDVVPIYAGGFNLTYTPLAATTIASGKEWPAAGNVLTLRIAGGNATTSILQPAAGSRTVGTALVLTKGVLDLVDNTRTLTLADQVAVSRTGDASITLNSNGVSTTNGVLAYGGMVNVTYTGTTALTTGVELPTGAAILKNLTLTRTGDVANFLVTNGRTITVNGALVIKNNLTSNNAITALGDVSVATDANASATSPVTTFNSALTFAGTTDQTFTVPSAGASVSAITVNKATGNLNVSGGDLTCTGTVTFTSGLIKTGATNALILTNSAGIAPVGGLTKTGYVRNVATGGKSHVVGNVKQNLQYSTLIAYARNEFPVGDDVNYRPVALTFQNATGSGNYGIFATVSHTNTRPTGTSGLPIANGIATGVAIQKYPGFFWSIATDGPMGATTFNLDLTAAGDPTLSLTDVGQNLVKIIRRSGIATDVQNQWNLQGVSSSYDNVVSNGVPTVIAVSATGGLSQAGAIFTYGLKSNLQVLNPPANLTGLVGGGAVVKVPLSTIFSGNTGALTYSVTSSNTSAATVALVATGDTVKITPVAAGTSTITITALDVDGSNISTTFTATVINANVTVSGTVTYGTTTNTIGAVTVTLTPASGAPVSAVSNASGVYSIANVPAGTYTLTASKTGNWGGCTAADALLITRHVVGLSLLTGLPLQAADVNASSSTTAADALLVTRRVVGLDASFVGGDWTFASQSVTVTSSNVTANVSGLAMGDVNASYTPASGTAFAKSASLSLANGTEKFGVATSSSVAIGSVTLRISAKSPISEITSKLPGFVSQINGSNATLTWYAADAKTAIQLNANEAIATVKLADKAAAGSSVSIATEMTDITGAAINSEVAVATLPTEFSLMQNYPNPFNPSTTINYNLPQSGKVTLTIYNVMGQEVAKLVNEQKDAGSYSIEWAPKNLASGMYIYRINVQTEKELLTSSKRLMLLK